MCDTVLRQRYGTTGGIKKIGTPNRTENGRGAMVALCAHPTYNHRSVAKKKAN
jgi:hypothetical protein